MKVAFHAAQFPALRGAWDSSQPLGFGYLAAWLRRARPAVECFLPRSEEELLASRADVVAITTATHTYGQARRVAALARERLGAVTVLGGPHVTALPASMDDEFDYGVLGEGEITFELLLEQLEQARPAPAPRQIDGLVFREDGRCVVNPRRAAIADLDSIPPPDRSLYDPAALHRGQISIMTSRGCPYECAFCATRGHWGRQRIHSAEYVLAEIDDIVRRWQPWQIVFEDDLFIADRRRFDAVADGILRAGHHRRTSFHVSGRANLLTDAVCSRLRAINTRSVFLGLESACDHVLARLDKKGLSAGVNQAALDTLGRHGLRAVATFILGTPGETFDDMYETYRFARNNSERFRSVTAGVLRLLPGTPFWEEGVARGLVDDELTGIVFSPRDVEDGWDSLRNRYPMLCETMTRNELLAMLLAFQEFSNQVREREEGARNIDAMGLRRLLGETARRVGDRLLHR